MVTVDPEYLQGRKVFGQVVCSFRYGREEDEVMGLNFQKDLFLASEQIYPPPEKVDRNNTRLQVSGAGLGLAAVAPANVRIGRPA